MSTQASTVSCRASQKENPEEHPVFWLGGISAGGPAYKESSSPKWVGLLSSPKNAAAGGGKKEASHTKQKAGGTNLNIPAMRLMR